MSINTGKIEKNSLKDPDRLKTIKKVFESSSELVSAATTSSSPLNQIKKAAKLDFNKDLSIKGKWVTHISLPVEFESRQIELIEEFLDSIRKNRNDVIFQYFAIRVKL